MTATESDVVEMCFPRFGFAIDKWISYEANSVFTTPSDGFHFVLSRNSIDDTVFNALQLGELFQIKVNGHTQAHGYIDRVRISASREQGTIIHVDGCDKLAQVVRAGIDPRTRFSTDGLTLHDVVIAVLAPFGYTSDSILTTNDTNRDLRSGQVRGAKVSKKGKSLKSYTLHQSKPYPSEGAFAFMSRLSQRHGLWIWLSAEGDRIIVNRPTFNQPPRYRLFAKLNGNGIDTNIEHGEAVKDSSQQPSCIIATGFSFGGDDGVNSRFKVIVVNELVATGPDGFATDAVSAIIAANEDASQLPIRSVFPPQTRKAHPAAQPMYLHDQESQTLDQLQNYARRELALRQKDSLRVMYTVPGHEQNGTIYCVDTIFDVDDDVRDIHEPLWCLGRTFHKSVDGGTYTTLELIRPHTLSFGDIDE